MAHLRHEVMQQHCRRGFPRNKPGPRLMRFAFRLHPVTGLVLGLNADFSGLRGHAYLHAVGVPHGCGTMRNQLQLFGSATTIMRCVKVAVNYRFSLTYAMSYCGGCRNELLRTPLF
ncbi:hypothetical protein [Pseudomonas sp. BR20]